MTRSRRVTQVAVAFALAAGVAAVPSPAGAAAAIGQFQTTAVGEQGGHEISGIAVLVRNSGRTYGRVVLFGLEPGVTYAAHLHNAPCANNAGGGHYKDDPNGPGAPPNELWFSSTSDPLAGVTANRAGIGIGRGSAEWVAADNAAAVVIHAVQNGNTAGGPKIACADLG